MSWWSRSWDATAAGSRWAGGIAGGAHIILIPEIPFTIKSVCKFIAQREKRGSRFTIVVVAEGIKLPAELKQMARGWPVGNTIGDAIGLFSNKQVRVSVLGHIQRGGSPSPCGRVLATRFGVAAVDLVAEGKFARWLRCAPTPLSLSTWSTPSES